jgi:hypothetical protein
MSGKKTYPWYGGGNDLEYLGGLVSYYCRIWSGRLIGGFAAIYLHAINI